MTTIEKIKRLRKNVKNWYLRPLERFGLVGKSVTYKLQNGLNFTFKSRTARSTLSIVEEQIESDPYNTPAVELQDGDMVLDIGANCGAFALFQAKNFPGISVVAFEPDPENYDYLLENIKSNDFSECIKTEKKAVVGKKTSDYVSLSLHPDQSGSHSIMDTGWSDEADVTKVPVVEFNEVLEKYSSKKDIAFVKMDCEGAEHDILMNTKPELLLKIRFLSLEYHKLPGHPLEDLKKHLNDVGFRVEETSLPGIWHCFNVA